MGFQLSSTLRQLCDEIGWSYAVFWRRGSHMSLAWGDAAVRDGTGGEGGVGSLVYEMMAPQVHVVGDGIVGQAGLTGRHQWIIWGGHGSLPMGLTEMNHHFLAGIQTIAVIPVLPHGVVQLGSTQMCSIDALLEKTIKHMLFLQSVTKHADKLKEVGEPKIVNREGGLLLKDNFEGGATWAFEVGTQSMICPIIVEDLNPPRQMLVEMLCEEQGLFLEIADLIRGLGLTILKGVMEARNDKVWARFAVEANRDVARMEIFLSLVRLLEPNAGSRMVPHGVENHNALHNMYQPSSSIPATGLSDHLR